MSLALRNLVAQFHENYSLVMLPIKGFDIQVVIGIRLVFDAVQKVLQEEYETKPIGMDLLHQQMHQVQVIQVSEDDDKVLLLMG